MYRKNSIHKVEYYPQFQASSGSLGMYPPPSPRYGGTNRKGFFRENYITDVA